jgi:hypothetical protein
MPLEEKIGNPDLFTGRKQEIHFFLKWMSNIQQKSSMSTAILSRRKTGKTALLQRLYNLTFEHNQGIIPFYYEIEEGKQWCVDFCQRFFLKFIFQYIAYKTRNTTYIYKSIEMNHLEHAKEIIQKEAFDYLQDYLRSLESLVNNERIDLLWSFVRNTPRTIASQQNEFIVQMIDEFQFLNSEIYRDKETKNQMNDFAAGYMSTAEYKNAPLLISGSWVGWLMDELSTMLPGRFQTLPLKNLPEDESLEMIHKYSKLYQITITEEIAFLIAQIAEGNPFYISTLIQSNYMKKDLTTKKGLLQTLEYETLNTNGMIKKTWKDYFRATIKKINSTHAKKIVLYLCKHKHRLVSKNEIRTQLHLPMTDDQLDNKMEALLRADIINRGNFGYQYQAVSDNIFEKVFISEYASDVDDFTPEQISHAYEEMLSQMQNNYFKLLGKYNQQKGLFAEYTLIDQLMYRAWKHTKTFKAMTHNLPKNFQFVQYDRVWSYKSSPLLSKDFQLDIFAQTQAGNYSLVGEVKKRDTKKFSLKEAQSFIKKIHWLIQIEKLDKRWVQGFVYSVSGFYRNAIQCLEKNGIAWSEHPGWLEP